MEAVEITDMNTSDMRLSPFLTHCVEIYAEHAAISAPEVYRLFAKTGLLAMLVSDYEDLHGMSFEYLMRFFDEYLEPAAEQPPEEYA